MKIKPKTNPTSYNSGFSLIELLVVMAIMIVLTVQVSVNFQQLRGQQELSAALNDVISKIRETQTNILSGKVVSGTSSVPKAYQIVFTTNTSNYRIDYITSTATTTLETVNLAAHIEAKQVYLNGNAVAQAALRIESPFAVMSVNGLNNQTINIDINHKGVNKARTLLVDGVSGRIESGPAITPPSPPPPPPSPPDTTPPTVSITAPSSGATAAGTITVSANASDNVGVVGVQFQLDGANLGAEVTASPYSVSWNTTSSSNQTHTLTAIARDAASNQTTSSAVSVIVINNWYNPSWGYRKKITVDPTKVSGGQSNFPMLVNRTDADWKTTGNGGHMGNNDASDTVLVDWEGKKLNHEIEKYTAATGELVTWVKMPFVSSTSTRDVYLYYGNAGVANQTNKTGVWDNNYVAVFHLGNGSTLSVNDSTSHAYNGTNTGPPTAAAAWVDGGADFGGVGQYTALPSGMTRLSGTMTVEAWVKRDTNPANEYYITSDWSSTARNFILSAKPTAFRAVIGNGGSSQDADILSTPISNSTWYHVVIRRNGTDHRLYVNGAPNASQTGSYSGGSTTNTRNIAADNCACVGYLWDGIIDEVRFSSIARSAAWILTGYNNQSSPATFYSVGSEQPQP